MNRLEFMAEDLKPRSIAVENVEESMSLLALLGRLFPADSVQFLIDVDPETRDVTLRVYYFWATDEEYEVVMGLWAKADGEQL